MTNAPAQTGAFLILPARLKCDLSLLEPGTSLQGRKRAFETGIAIRLSEVTQEDPGRHLKKAEWKSPQAACFCHMAADHCHGLLRRLTAAEMSKQVIVSETRKRLVRINRRQTVSGREQVRPAALPHAPGAAARTGCPERA
ncbi:hypothetical protein ROS1_39420 [Roseibium sp. ROS1]